jgi:hypothetical protein
MHCCSIAPSTATLSHADNLRQPAAAELGLCVPQQRQRCATTLGVYPPSPLQGCRPAPLWHASIPQAGPRAPGLQVPACKLMHWMLLLLLLLAAAAAARWAPARGPAGAHSMRRDTTNDRESPAAGGGRHTLLGGPPRAEQHRSLLLCGCSQRRPPPHAQGSGFHSLPQHVAHLSPFSAIGSNAGDALVPAGQGHSIMSLGLVLVVLWWQ